jgi:putative oxidoreductase
MHGVDIGSLIIRLSLGFTLFAHGWNHMFRGGKIPGTGRWFESLGMRPGKLHALLASFTELGAGVLMVLGLLTPLAAAGGFGTLFVAFLINHRKNGFFIFRPGEGYEYVLMICCVSLALGALGGGKVSLDNAVGLDSWDGWAGFLTTLIVGGGGALLLLAAFWRPNKVAPATSAA